MEAEVVEEAEVVAGEVGEKEEIKIGLILLNSQLIELTAKQIRPHRIRNKSVQDTKSLPISQSLPRRCQHRKVLHDSCPPIVVYREE